MLEGSDLMKRIVLCADGTWNVRDQVDKASNTRRPTNVTKVAHAVRPRASNGTDQALFYHEGVGTAGGLDRYTGGAFGEGIEANISELYRFLVYNYEPGDELYFFGFSRGAFTVRTLAGLMNKVGLVQKDDDYYVPELYACYEGSKGPGSPEWIKAFHNTKVPRPCPPIRFIGVWDTVGALGAPGFLGQFLNKDKYKYHDVGLNPHIRERLSCPCHRRTAQALPAQSVDTRAGLDRKPRANLVSRGPLQCRRGLRARWTGERGAALDSRRRSVSASSSMPTTSSTSRRASTRCSRIR